MNVPDRFIEWTAAGVLAALGGTFALVRRWISMLHKHEQQIALLQQNFTHQQETNVAMIKALTEVKESVDQNRVEAATQLSSLRTELRDDINRVITLMRK